MKRLETNGKNASAEVLNISLHGLRILVNERELYLDFANFPWFKTATIEQIGRIEQPSANHLYWPELDMDLDLDNISNPEKIPVNGKITQSTVA